jgi:hypothetical protein
MAYKVAYGFFGFEVLLTTVSAKTFLYDRSAVETGLIMTKMVAAHVIQVFF